MVKLKLLFKFTLYFNELYISGLIVVFFGYSYSHLVLHLYGGRTLSEGLGPDLLRSQCFLILFLATFLATSVRVIVNTFRDQEEQPIMGLVPDTDITLLLISAGATCLLSEVYIYSWSALAHLASGAVMFLVVVVALVVKEDYMGRVQHRYE